MTKKPKRQWSCFFGTHDFNEQVKEFHYKTGGTSAFGRQMGFPEVETYQGFRTMAVNRCNKPGCSHVQRLMVSDSLDKFDFEPYKCDKYGNKT